MEHDPTLPVPARGQRKARPGIGIISGSIPVVDNQLRPLLVARLGPHRNNWQQGEKRRRYRSKPSREPSLVLRLYCQFFRESSLKSFSRYHSHRASLYVINVRSIVQAPWQSTLLPAEPTSKNPNPKPVFISNAQLYSLVADAVSALLQCGLVPGDRIASYTSNRIVS